MPQLTPSTVSLIDPTQSSGGSAKQSANVIRFRPTVDGDSKLWAAVSDGLNVAQSQIDAIMNVLRQPVPQPQVIQITDPSGALVAQIGNMTGSDNVAYPGIWAKDLYVGGNGPDTAVIVASDGGVAITGASIILNKDGVLTTINNVLSPDGLTNESLTSQDVSGGPGTHGPLTAVNPLSFVCWDYNTSSLQYEPVATMRAAGGAGRILLARLNSGNAVTIATSGGGAPFVNVTNGTVTASQTQSGFTVTGASSLPIAQLLESSLIMTQAGMPLVTINTGGTVGVVALHNTAGTHVTFVRATGISTSGGVAATGDVSGGTFTAAGVPGIDASDTVVTAVVASTAAFVDSISVSTTSISYTPGATVATFVSAVGSTTSAAVFNVGVGSASKGYTKGLRTS